MNSTIGLEIFPYWQDRLGRGMMWLAALGAFTAFIAAGATVTSAAPETVWVETWRLFGFLVFTGMFILLALRPRNSAGIWELAFFHKMAMAISALFLSNADGAVVAGTVDAILALLITMAYILTRGWRAWRTPAGTSTDV